MAEVSEMVSRVAARRLAADGYFEVGEEVLYGRYKNKRGRVVALNTDDRGVPTVEIEPIPKGRKQNRTMGLYKIWKLPEARKTAAMNREACIIAGVMLGDGLCLMKTRDRAYVPKLQVLHVERDGTEMAVVYDQNTGYMEGVNEHGIGVVNTTLMVVRDEQEGVKKVKTQGQKGPKRSKDGPKIFKALEARTLEDAIEILISYREGIKGHTFVADGDRMVCIERSSKHPAKIDRLDPTRVNTRTNHGVAYPDAGYTHGDDYVSSIVRRWEAQKRLQSIKNPEVAAPVLVQAIHDADSPFNPVRCTDKMRTTSQLTIDTTHPGLYLYLIPGHSKLAPARNMLPGGRQPKIPVRVFRYRQKLEDREEKPGKWAAAERVAARYKSKKKVKTEDGDETTVYEYSERQVQHRDREKATRLEKLRKSLGRLRTQLDKDIGSDDPKRRDLALAVGLMDHTYERPGNDDSASDGHHGVTTWKVENVKFRDGKTKIDYVGKSGVRQSKEVTDSTLVKALKGACADKAKDARCLEVSADEVNDYLRPFGITAKDLRGLHANREMKERLRRVRRQGPRLPEDRKERDEVLKKEFKRALEQAADAVGHEPSTLRSQYLVPGLEEDYMKDGTVKDSHAKKGAEAVTDTASLYVIAPEALKGMLDDTDWLEIAHELWPGGGRPTQGNVSGMVGEMERHIRESGGAVLDTGMDGGFDVGVRGQYPEMGGPPVPFDLPVREKGALRPYGLRTAAENGTSTEQRILANAMLAPVLVGRSRGWWLREAPNLYRLARDQERPRPAVEGVKFPPELFTVLWYEDADGNRLEELSQEGLERPEGAKYQHSQFPHVLQHNVLRLNDDGTSTNIGGGEASYPRDLVNAMVRSGDWDVGDAIMVAGQTCERCLNVLCYHYDLDDGYPFGSEDYWKTRTRCPMCEHVDNSPEKALERQAGAPTYEAYVERKRRRGGKPLDREAWERQVFGAPPEKKTPNWEKHRKELMERHKLDRLHAPYDPKEKHLKIDLIRVREDARGEGHGQRAMDELLEWADRGGITVTLTPTADFGASKKRLTRWYEGMGFVPNKGQNKDFRFQETMLRAPQTKTATKSDAEVEDEQVRGMLRSEPKKKPPRYDLRDNRPLEGEEEEGEDLGGGDGGDRDLSLKWNKVGRRVAFRWMATPRGPSATRVVLRHEAKMAPDSEFQKEIEDQQFTHPKTRNEVGFKSLPTEEQHRIYEDWKKKHGKPDEEGKKKTKKPEERSSETLQKDLDEARSEAKKTKRQLRDLEDRMRDAKQAIKDWSVHAKGDVGEEIRVKALEVIEEMKTVVAGAEEDIEELKVDLRDARARVKALKEEQKDPSGEARKREEQQAREQERRKREAVRETTGAIENLLGKGSRLPPNTQEQIEAALGDYDYDQYEVFSTAFQADLKEMIQDDPLSEEAIARANRQAKIGFDVEGVTDPEELANRVAEIAHTQNVVANPMIVGGKPVGQTLLDNASYGERAKAAFAQFRDLTPKLQRMAADRLRTSLKGLDPDTDRAKEMEAILTGIDVAHVGATGDALPGRPQPSAGNAALIRKMIENDTAELMFRPKEDFFSEEAREVTSAALREMDSEDIAQFITGNDPNHPFASLADAMVQGGASEYAQFMKDFLIADFLNDTWGDRAARDVMKAAEVEDWDSPEARARLLEESKKEGESRLGEVLAAKERIEEARAGGQSPSEEDVELVKAFFEPESGEGVVGNAKALLGLLGQKFKKHVVSPAIAVLNHFVKTRDPKVLRQETQPHPDEGSPEPRPKEERERARAPEVEERKLAEPETPEKALHRRVVLKSLLQKLKTQRDKVGPEEREKYDARIRQLDEELERGSVPAEAEPEKAREPEPEKAKEPEKAREPEPEKAREPEKAESEPEKAREPEKAESEPEKAKKPEKAESEPEKAKKPEAAPDRRERLEKVKSVRDRAEAKLKTLEPAARRRLERKLERVDAAVKQVEEQHAEDDEHGPGDVWETKAGNWRAKDEDGVPRSFKKRDEAEAYAKGGDEDETWTGEFKVPVEERGPTRFATGVSDVWLARVRAIHPDDPERPLIVLDAA